MTYSYRWKIDGMDITGATSSTYTVAEGETEKNFTCTITAEDGYGGTESCTTAAVSFKTGFPWHSFVPNLGSRSKVTETDQ